MVNFPPDWNIAVGTFDPDWKIPERFEDFESGRDRILERVLEDVAARRQSND